MKRWAGQLLICALTCWSAGAYAQASATPPSSEASSIEPTFAASRPEPTFAVRPRETPAPPSPAARNAQVGKLPTPDEICHTIEQSAAENGLPVEF